jgi:hypothetical protein
MIEALCSSETSVLTIDTRRNILEDGIVILVISDRRLVDFQERYETCGIKDIICVFVI